MREGGQEEHPRPGDVYVWVNMFPSLNQVEWSVSRWILVVVERGVDDRCWVWMRQLENQLSQWYMEEVHLRGFYNDLDEYHSGWVLVRREET